MAKFKHSSKMCKLISIESNSVSINKVYATHEIASKGKKKNKIK